MIFGSILTLHTKNKTVKPDGWELSTCRGQMEKCVIYNKSLVWKWWGILPRHAFLHAWLYIYNRGTICRIIQGSHMASSQAAKRLTQGETTRPGGVLTKVGLCTHVCKPWLGIVNSFQPSSLRETPFVPHRKQLYCFYIKRFSPLSVHLDPIKRF